MRIAHLTAECVPFAKTGGLGDVAAALPKALARRGHAVEVWMPFHLEAAEWFRKRQTWPEQATDPIDVHVLGQAYRVGILRGVLPGSGVPVNFVAHDPFFHRPHVYAPNDLGYDDGLWRFSVFVRAAVEGMKRLGKPQLIHVHDWHPALGNMLAAWSSWRDRWFDDIASVLTIHNIAHQGVYDRSIFPALGLAEESVAGIEHHGPINLLKGAVVAADIVTTVSPSYAFEIRTREGGNGLDAVLRSRSDRLAGILNGIDTDEWNPRRDPALPAPYSSDDLGGKAICRQRLCEEAGFDPADQGLIVGAIGRLTWQKGFDMLLDALPEIFSRGIRVIMLGSGEAHLEESLHRWNLAAPGRFRAFVGYNEAQAHRIEAGVDTLVMPSRFEPCGLSQMYSLAYGTPPVVRHTGGLCDSVTGFDGHNIDRATGFFFYDQSPRALTDALVYAQAVFHSDGWHRLMLNGMSRDFSWHRSAADYEGIYRWAREVRGLPW